MSDLVTWLRAQLDADEQAAREALRGDLPAVWVTEHGGVRTAEPYRRPGHVWDGQTVMVARVLGTVGEFRAEMRNARHIAVHDPARVLRQVAAMRAIVELHAEPHPCRVAVRDGPFVGPWERIDLPAVDSLDPQPIEPCLTLRLLATTYADRDGYRPEWSAE